MDGMEWKEFPREMTQHLRIVTTLSAHKIRTNVSENDIFFEKYISKYIIVESVNSWEHSG